MKEKLEKPGFSAFDLEASESSETSPNGDGFTGMGAMEGMEGDDKRPPPIPTPRRLKKKAVSGVSEEPHNVTALHQKLNLGRTTSVDKDPPPSPPAKK